MCRKGNQNFDNIIIEINLPKFDFKISEFQIIFFIDNLGGMYNDGNLVQRDILQKKKKILKLGLLTKVAGGDKINSNEQINALKENIENKKSDEDKQKEEKRKKDYENQKKR